MDAKAAYQAVLGEVKKHIAGKDDVIELMFIALVADGHVLLEGVPGVAKTTMTKALADAIQADFKRIQGTPDLEVKDIIGFAYVDDTTKEVMLKKGPIFTNILLIDELNRAPPRTTTARGLTGTNAAPAPASGATGKSGAKVESAITKAIRERLRKLGLGKVLPAVGAR